MDESALRRALDSLDDCTSSLHGWLRFWTLLVVVGVALEIVFVVWEYLEEWQDRKTCLLVPPVKPHLPLFLLGFLGAGLVTAGVAGELNVESKIATVETCIRKGNNQLSLLLSEEAGDAKTSAQKAADAAQLAEDRSGKAVESASTALSLAKGARKEADSFKGDIATAKQQAGEAKSQIEGAFKEAKEATAELNRLKTPRVLLTPSEVAKALKAFKTEYAFASVFQDEESVELLKEIDAALQLAGWKRVPFAVAPNTIEITLDSGIKVPTGVKTGVLVSVETPEPIESIRSMPEDKLPELIRVAIVLRTVLVASISPDQRDIGKTVTVRPGSSRAIQIDVGKHP